MIITLRNPNANSRYSFETAKISKLHPPSSFDMDGWYGGNIAYIAELRDSHIYLILDTQYKVMDVAVKSEDLKLLDIRDLRDFAKRKNISYIANIPKEDLVAAILESLN